MKRYVMANIKIPVVINENGLFDMLNEYTQTEITSLNELPAIEGEDNLYKKIIEFLENKKDDLEEPVQKIKIKDCIEEMEKETSEETEKESSKETEKESSEETEKESSEERSEEMCNSTMEQILTICKNNIKMRKHSNNMTFKNIKNCKKGVKSYTRKTYE
jgi:ribosomal protein L12E/L44/L45/RPP1/RPP2